MPSRLTRPKRRLARAVLFELPVILFLMGYQTPYAAGEQPGDQPSLALVGAVGTPVKGFTATEAEFQLPACTTGTVVTFSWDGVVVRSDRLRAPDCKIAVEVKPKDPAAGDLGQHEICARVSGPSGIRICRPYRIIQPCSQTNMQPPCFIGGMGGSPTLTPQQKQALLIMGDLETLQSGVFALWLPKIAREGETVKVTLRVGTSDSAPYVGSSSAPPAEQGPVGKIGNVVSARLSAATDPSAIDIQSEAGAQAEHTISGAQFATWNWFVRPSKAGVHQLHVDVMVRLAGLPAEVPPIAFALGQDRAIDVRRSTSYEVAGGVGSLMRFNWASIAALFTVIGGIAAAITWLLRRRRRTVVLDDTPSPQPSVPHRRSESRPTASSSPKRSRWPK